MNYEILKSNCDGVEMEYLKFGTGKKNLVILPGIAVTSVLGSAKDIVNNYQMFAEDYTVYLFDRRLNLPEGYTIYDAREDTRKAMKSVGIEKAYMFGASQGGIMTMIIAITHPELTEKITVGSTIRSVYGIQEGVNWLEEAENGSIKNLSLAFMSKVYTNPGPILKMAKLAPEKMFGTKEDLERFKIMYKANENYDIRDRLCEIKCPVLAIGGRKDVVAKWEESVEIANRTGGESYIYEEFGHAAYDEAPDYKERLKAFFEK